MIEKPNTIGGPEGAAIMVVNTTYALGKDGDRCRYDG